MEGIDPMTNTALRTIEGGLRRFEAFLATLTIGDEVMGDIINLRPPLYEAKIFQADTQYGQFKAAGTLCGHIDFVGPWRGSYPLSPDEALEIIVMLKGARQDVLDHSNPLNDPRLED